MLINNRLCLFLIYLVIFIIIGSGSSGSNSDGNKDCQSIAQFDPYITIELNNGYVSSIGSQRDLKFSYTKNIGLEGYEYFRLEYGPAVYRIGDPYLTQELGISFDNLWGTSLYSLKKFISTNSYLCKDGAANKNDTSMAFTSKDPCFFKINFLNIACSNQGNIDNEILYSGSSSSKDCSSIQFGYQKVIIKSIYSNYYLSAVNSAVQTNSQPLSNNNYFKITPFENNKIGFQVYTERNYRFLSFNGAKTLISDNTLNNSKFILEFSGYKNQYYIKTESGCIREIKEKEGLGRLVVDQSNCSKFLIQLESPLCSDNSSDDGFFSSGTMSGYIETNATNTVSSSKYDTDNSSYQNGAPLFNSFLLFAGILTTCILFF